MGAWWSTRFSKAVAGAPFFYPTGAKFRLWGRATYNTKSPAINRIPRLEIIRVTGNYIISCSCADIIQCRCNKIIILRCHQHFHLHRVERTAIAIIQVNGDDAAAGIYYAYEYGKTLDNGFSAAVSQMVEGYFGKKSMEELIKYTRTPEGRQAIANFETAAMARFGWTPSHVAIRT